MGFISVFSYASSVYQQQLPATGVPITRQRFDHMREKFREYVRIRTLQDWKFWIVSFNVSKSRFQQMLSHPYHNRAHVFLNWSLSQFSVIIEPLFESYNGMVSTASIEDLCRTTLSWLDQHCSLPALRPSELRSASISLSSVHFHISEPWTSYQKHVCNNWE